MITDDAIALGLSKSRSAVKRELDAIFSRLLGEYGATFGVGPNVAVAIGRKGDSVAQGNKSLGGRILENLVLDAFDQACEGHARFDRQWKVPGFKRRPMDGYLETDTVIWVVSIARSTRERKPGTWNDEYAHCLKHAAEIGKPLRFLGVTDDVKATEVESLRGRVNRQVEVVWLPNRDGVRQLLSDIGASVR